LAALGSVQDGPWAALGSVHVGLSAGAGACSQDEGPCSLDADSWPQDDEADWPQDGGQVWLAGVVGWSPGVAAGEGESGWSRGPWEALVGLVSSGWSRPGEATVGLAAADSSWGVGWVCVSESGERDGSTPSRMDIWSPPAGSNMAILAVEARPRALKHR
jgi:hypothetical protein